MGKLAYRGATFVVLGLWLLAFWLPQTQVTHFSDQFRFASPSLLAPDGMRGGPGSILAELGWLGPIMLAFEWYANIPLAMCTLQMASGKPPKRWLALLTAATAFTVPIPYRQTNWPETGGYYLAWIAGPAVWSWLAAVAAITLASLTTSRQSAHLIRFGTT